MKQLLYILLILILISCQPKQEDSNQNDLNKTLTYFLEVSSLKLSENDLVSYDVGLDSIQKKYGITSASQNDVTYDVALVNKKNDNTEDSKYFWENQNITPIYRLSFYGDDSKIVFETKNLKSSKHDVSADTILYLIEEDLNSTYIKTIAYNDDFGEMLSSRLPEVFLEKDKKYTLIIHSYNLNTNGFCDLYKNGLIYKENIKFGGLTIKRTFGDKDLSYTENLTSGCDTLIMICLYNEQKLSYEIAKYSDDTQKDLSTLAELQLYTDGIKKGYILIGAYSPLSIGRADIYAIKGGNIDLFEK
ncbi:MAG: hypothetical protein A2086_07025 [Spirochaetes bacterium GWD1_27_9]|nr:MAG: hypothetical protein A2Z98_15655 [Spirochaetes bacterium GWB1_27_13]OHD26400.1 MAG: hypothetical protein A2Y34_14880 [Spirochaetes bacterium GWC1_27_15]OHD44449.1 MAG: hypothetical protein A2086_07025 [Spirochaetes bacterium GWD1_27_9]